MGDYPAQPTATSEQHAFALHAFFPSLLPPAQGLFTTFLQPQARNWKFLTGREKFFSSFSGIVVAI